MGELSKALEKAESHGGDIRLLAGGKSNSDQLSDAGVSTSATVI